ACLYKSTRESNSEALRLFLRAIDLDPEFSSAYGLASTCYNRRRTHGWLIDAPQEFIATERIAVRAIELGKNDPVALAHAGFILCWYDRDLNELAALMDRALQLNQNLVFTFNTAGWIHLFLG